MSSVEHKIIHLDQCGTEEVVNNIRKLDLKQMKCQTHHDRTCFVFCRNCNQPICSSCILNIHQNHKFCEIDDAYEEKLAHIEKLKVEIKSNIAFMRNENTLLKEYELKGKEHHMEIRTLILNREEEVKQEIARKSKDVSDELETEWHNIEQSINRILSCALKLKAIF
ncbi:TRIM35 [Mytilus edulis]|uniref:TRIM35 n=1 Tax=Mytilus edulis TaxID=6550 RepID=A0A8S3VH91_MYTED|nr:TRIM35 [Mytilus edulis]